MLRSQENTAPPSLDALSQNVCLVRNQWDYNDYMIKKNLFLSKTESSARNRLESSYNDIAPPPQGVIKQRLFLLVALLKESLVFALMVA